MTAAVACALAAALLSGCGTAIETVSRQDAIRIAQERSVSSAPTRVLEIRYGTYRDLHVGPSIYSGGGVSRTEGERLLARSVWLVVLVGWFPGNCPIGCAPEEGREEMIIDAQTGDGISHTTMIAPGGIAPVPRDQPCPGGRECGP